MNLSLCPGYPHVVPEPTDVAAPANTTEADAADDSRAKLVGLAFDAHGYYSYVVLDHAANCTPTGFAA